MVGRTLAFRPSQPINPDTAQIMLEFDRDYKAMLSFGHDLQKLYGELKDLTLSEVEG